ncbi:Acetylcholine receptor subunit alpha-like [Amphibalanus amphitrite]|uniref:Acetylcholine receptor subunit alpha-like n=1 Tax=Amphibalanus amphitrite TaxID=1232801 RepID=A0A6A4WB25_AMPAM|nr:Acetylcholine receptor subunit alpha-like [Amphibalanus amphitrite]
MMDRPGLAMQPSVLAVLALLAVLPATANPDASRLYDDLLSNYNKLVRPVVNTTDVLQVFIKLKLSQLIDVAKIARGERNGQPSFESKRRITFGGEERRARGKKRPQL